MLVSECGIWMNFCLFCQILSLMLYTKDDLKRLNSAPTEEEDDVSVQRSELMACSSDDSTCDPLEDLDHLARQTFNVRFSASLSKYRFHCMVDRSYLYLCTYISEFYSALLVGTWLLAELFE